MRIFWAGDAVTPTGFSRVTHAVLDRLAARGHEIAVMGINYNGDPHDHPYRIYPTGADKLGVPRIASLVEQFHPDLVFCFNDLWIACDWLNALRELRDKQGFRMACYTPVDGPAVFDSLAKELGGFDLVVAYTEGGRRTLRECGCTAPIEVVPHGVDQDRFWPMDRDVCRAKFAYKPGEFVVGNANRNQPRKNIDLTIRAFIEFCKLCPERAHYLHLHMGAKDLGWNIGALFNQAAKQARVSNARLTYNPDHLGAGNAPDEYLRVVLNAFDVNVNTSQGEGWGLVAFETAACRVAQIQPDHSACAELWGDRALLTPVKMWTDDLHYGVPRGYIDTTRLASQLRHLYRKPQHRDELAEKAYQYAILPQFSWDAVADRFEALFKQQLATRAA